MNKLIDVKFDQKFEIFLDFLETKIKTAVTSFAGVLSECVLARNLHVQSWASM